MDVDFLDHKLLEGRAKSLKSHLEYRECSMWKMNEFLYFTVQVSSPQSHVNPWGWFAASMFKKNFFYITFFIFIYYFF